MITSGNTVDLCDSHAEAAQVKSVLTKLILGTHPSKTAQDLAAVAPARAAAPQADVTVQLSKLVDLRTAGVLTDEEFSPKKGGIVGKALTFSAVPNHEKCPLLWMRRGIFLQ
ncbi:hypothetical protein E3T39_07255 [Cryobacterium suzukii]|uniref:SHOCT domain-containing protein n=1 Tax=Cryobacterium suzukii TaxID=1259198 RepID=A0A4R9AG12_9MICO|nr:hypothetical protein [Cryobacterium suzukii]TFD60906.1 hypothetical protein E3T39_07255 [Cryobacterium suzukii]